MPRDLLVARLTHEISRSTAVLLVEKLRGNPKTGNGVVRHQIREVVKQYRDS